MLSLGAPLHDVADIYLAQDDIAEVRKTSSRSSIANSTLTQVIVGDVVDRGGRIGERRRASSKMPEFKYVLGTGLRLLVLKCYCRERTTSSEKHRAADTAAEPKAKRAKTSDSTPTESRWRGAVDYILLPQSKELTMLQRKMQAEDEVDIKALTNPNS